MRGSIYPELVYVGARGTSCLSLEQCSQLVCEKIVILVHMEVKITSPPSCVEPFVVQMVDKQFVYIPTQKIPSLACVCVCVCVCVCKACVCAWGYTPTCTCVCVHGGACILMCVCVFVGMHGTQNSH